MCFAIYDQTVVIDYSVYMHSRDKLVSFVEVCRLWTQSGLQRQTLDARGNWSEWRRHINGAR